MKSLILVQSNTGQGHISRANALGEYLNDRVIITRPFTGVLKTDFTLDFTEGFIYPSVHNLLGVWAWRSS